MKIALHILLGICLAAAGPAHAENGSHVSSTVSKVLSMVRQRAAAAQSGPGLFASLYTPIQQYLERPSGDTLRLFRKPITVENLKTDSNLPDELREVEYLSKAGSSIFDPMPKTVEERLHFLANDIEDGHPLSSERQKEYEKALGCLYSDPDKKTPTRDYKIFLAYRGKRKKLVEQYQNAPTYRERSLIDLDLKSLDEDYLGMSPQFGRIESCLQTVESVEREKKMANAGKVKDALMGAHKPDYDLSSVLRGQSGWTRFQSTVSANGELMIEGKPINSRVNRVACNLVALNVDWPSVFNDSRIEGGQWKNSAGYVLSTEDASHESPNELLPRLNTSMILADKWEVSFANSNVVSAIRSALQQGRRVTLGGVELSRDHIDFTGPTTLRVNSAQVIGVIDQRMPRSPRVP